MPAICMRYCSMWLASFAVQDQGLGFGGRTKSSGVMRWLCGCCGRSRSSTVATVPCARTMALIGCIKARAFALIGRVVSRSLLVIGLASLGPCHGLACPTCAVQVRSISFRRSQPPRLPVARQLVLRASSGTVRELAGGPWISWLMLPAMATGVASGNPAGASARDAHLCAVPLPDLGCGHTIVAGREARWTRGDRNTR